MCQKLLTKIPSPDSGSQQRCDAFSRSCVNFNKSSLVSEVCKVEEIYNRGMPDQQMGDTCADNNDHHVTDAIDSVTMVKLPSSRDQQCQNGTSSQCFLEKQVDRYNGLYKYYTRRKLRKVSQCFLEKQADRYNGQYKCYTRRKSRKALQCFLEKQADRYNGRSKLRKACKGYGMAFSACIEGK